MSLRESYWVIVPWWSVKKATRILWLAFLGSVLLGIVAFTLYINSFPSLSTWHTTILKNEYNSRSDVKDFDDYIALEDKLFYELNDAIYKKVLEGEKNKINRYTQNSLSDPKRWDKAWNRSFELAVKDPRMGVLLIHGMSDSPYSLHTQAQYLQKQGVWVVSMRMPGHGTIPSGLIELKWKDMAAAVKIGMQRLVEKVGNKPIHIMGYSTGAALAMHYTHTSLDDPSLRIPESLIFYSPAVGVSKAAPFAVWQSRLGHFLGSEKLSWNTLGPEFDPFKYASFAVNAGDQVYRVCTKVQKQFDKYEKKEDKKPFPPVLSFASIVDSTVSVNDIISKLYGRLPKGEHTLVLFDINHNFSSNHLIKGHITTSLDALRQPLQNKNYTFDLISDINTTQEELMLIRDGVQIKNLSMHWPKDLYSLSHLSLPISSNDPLYGDQNAPKSPGIKLGHLAIYGETGVLQTTAASLLRQRWNPFHEYTKKRVLEFLKLK